MGSTACIGTSTTGFDIRFHNDLAAPIHLYQCLGLTPNCSAMTTGVRMLPLQTAAGVAHINLPNIWLIQQQGAKPTLCIKLPYTSVPPATPIIQLSSATPEQCPKR